MSKKYVNLFVGNWDHNLNINNTTGLRHITSSISSSLTTIHLVNQFFFNYGKYVANFYTASTDHRSN